MFFHHTRTAKLVYPCNFAKLMCWADFVSQFVVDITFIYQYSLYLYWIFYLSMMPNVRLWCNICELIFFLFNLIVDIFIVHMFGVLFLQVKLVKCIVQDIVVDISFNQLGGLSTLCFLEKVLQFVLAQYVR